MEFTKGSFPVIKIFLSFFFTAERFFDIFIFLLERIAFGKPIADQGVWQERVGLSRIEIEQVRNMISRLYDIV